METTNLDTTYGSSPVEWSFIEDRLAGGISQGPGTGGPNRHTCWLTTINADGSPHVTGVGALWVDDTFWFETSAGSRKGKNVARDPRCALSLATNQFDLVVEGDARKITDPSTVATLAQHWADQGWPARVDETGEALTAAYSAPSAGPPPWHVYRLDIRTATALRTTEPGGATRWRFSSR
jgi:PPOX class probable F420-dependent enzyme